MKMKIGFVISTLRGGGAERVAVVLSDWFLKEGHIIKIIVFDNSKQDYTTECEVIDLNITSGMSRLARVLNIFKRIVRLNSLFSKEKYDLIISSMSQANFYASLLSKFYHYHLISTIHNYNNDGSIDGYLGDDFIQRFIVKNSLTVVCVSNEIRLKYIRLFPEFEKKIITIYNPFTPKVTFRNENLYQQIRRFKSDSKLIINTGRLEHQKGQWLLIHAIKKLIDLNNNIKLVVFGEGKLRNLLLDIVDELQISEHVMFMGYVKEPYAYYELGELFVMTSIYEGLPVAILEAMANGLPIISTDCKAGPCEILNPRQVSLYDKDENKVMEKYGLLTHTPINNYNIEENLVLNEFIVKELVEKTLILLDNERLRLYYSKQSKLRSEDFNIQLIFSKWSEFIFKQNDS